MSTKLSSMVVEIVNRSQRIGHPLSLCSLILVFNSNSAQDIEQAFKSNWVVPRTPGSRKHGSSDFNREFGGSPAPRALLPRGDNKLTQYRTVQSSENSVPTVTTDRVGLQDTLNRILVCPKSRYKVPHTESIRYRLMLQSSGVLVLRVDSSWHLANGGRGGDCWNRQVRTRSLERGAPDHQHSGRLQHISYAKALRKYPVLHSGDKSGSAAAVPQGVNGAQAASMSPRGGVLAGATEASDYISPTIRQTDSQSTFLGSPIFGKGLS
ncbi:hypothetical protein J6590_082387 [Homalodisca vitripennis]|nr:hypothetical protein J6590_082387 [Homalodisca vitripennis]